MRYRKNNRISSKKPSREPKTLQTLAHNTISNHNDLPESAERSLVQLSMKKQQSKIERYCWKVCFTICMLVLFRFCAILVIKFLKRPTHLSMEMNIAEKLVFPAVTICNNGKYFNSTHPQLEKIKIGVK